MTLSDNLPQPNNSSPANSKPISPLPPQTGGTSKPSAVAPEETQTIKDEYLYFNVMPRVKTQEPFTEPTLEIKSDAPKFSETNKQPAGSKKTKFYIFAAIAVAVLGAAVYFGITKFFLNSYKPENILVVNHQAQKPILENPSSSSTLDSAVTPPQWRAKYFPGCADPALCGDDADPDHDGLLNLDEQKLGSDPNNKDSDNDLISDGDEVHIFSSDPLSLRTTRDPKYTDTDYIKNGYNIHIQNKKLTAEEITAISQKMQTLGLHEPTVNTLKALLDKIYKFNLKATDSSAASSTPASSSTPLGNLDMSPQAKQDRDAQRSNTIKNVSIALAAYFKDKGEYPDTQNFSEFSTVIKPYLKVATNFTDPVNIDPYIYGYTPLEDKKDFTLSFYSETQAQIIKKHAADAAKDAQAQEAELFDNQRKDDLDSIRIALLLYSQSNISGTQDYVFPTVEKYKTSLVPAYLSAIPKDPKTLQDYSYQVSKTFDTFTIKAVLDNPPAGTTGFSCNQDECMNY